MARATDQFRSSDVTFWGIVALVCGGIAMLSANVSALVPQSVFASLHATRLDGATLNQVRAQVATLQDEAQRLRRDNAALANRFTLAERASGEVVRRVGAIEVALPDLQETLSAAIDTIAVDTRNVTASTTADGPQTFEVDGGTVTVQQRLLVPAGTADPTHQALPPLAVTIVPPVADPDAFGIALGPTIAPGEADAAWTALNAQVGTLLLGLGPLVEERADGRRLVVGPLRDKAQAEALCREVTRAEVACAAVPFVGTPLVN